MGVYLPVISVIMDRILNQFMKSVFALRRQKLNIESSNQQTEHTEEKHTHNFIIGSCSTQPRL